jgi:hypothetical protein
VTKRRGCARRRGFPDAVGRVSLVRKLRGYRPAVSFTQYPRAVERGVRARSAS